MTSPRRDPSVGRGLLELLGLSGIAVAQPLLSVFGGAPEYFVFEGAERSEIVAFGVAVALVPGLLLWVATRLVGLAGARAGRVAHAAAVGLLVGLVVAQLAAAVGWTSSLVLTVGVATGLAAAGARLHWPPVGTWAAWLALGPAAFLALFLFASPVSGLVVEGEVETAELGPFGSGDPPPIVFVVFDEWPLASVMRTDGTIDRGLYPNLADLADTSTWHRDTTTVANLTNFAVPSILTGRFPVEGQTADAATHPESLFTLLGGTYRLHVTERVTRLCPRSLCTGGGSGPVSEEAGTMATLLGEAASVFRDRLTPGAGSEPVTDAFVEPDAAVAEARRAAEGQNLEDILEPGLESLNLFVDGIDGDEPPTLHFLHVLAPHTPHRHLPDGRRYEADPGLRQITTPDGSEGSDLRSGARPPAALDRQRLQLEAGFADRLLGQMTDHLRRTGLFDEALIVVTSDHGLSFAPGETARGLGTGPVPPDAQPELLWVPLLVKAPGQADGVVSDAPAQTVDILPTVADLLAIDLPWPVDGRSLVDPEPGPVDRRFVRVQGSSFAAFELDPPAALDADLDDVIGRGVNTVLPGRGPDRWYRTRVRPGLVGRPATVLPPGSTPAEAVLDDPFALSDVDTEARTLPVVVAGRSPVPSGTELVVVVEGTVAAVTRAYDDEGGPGRFATIVGPDLLIDGLNRVEVRALPGR